MSCQIGMNAFQWGDHRGRPAADQTARCTFFTASINFINLPPVNYSGECTSVEPVHFYEPAKQAIPQMRFRVDDFGRRPPALRLISLARLTSPSLLPEILGNFGGCAILIS